MVKKEKLIKSQGASLNQYKQLCTSNGMAQQQKALDTAHAKIVSQESKILAQAMTIRGHERNIKTLEQVQKKLETTKEALGKEKVKSAGLQAQLTVHVNNSKHVKAMLMAKKKHLQVANRDAKTSTCLHL